jgi:hypothetical protein
MRGRKPRPLKIASADHAVLCLIARSDDLPWYQVQRARIVLAIARGESSAGVAADSDCDPSTVWRICRRYEGAGLSGLLQDGRQTRRAARKGKSA